MKRIILILLNMSIAIIFLTGCGINANEQNTSNSNITPIPTTCINVKPVKDNDILGPTITPTISPYASLPAYSLAIESCKSVLQNKNRFYDTDSKKNIYLKDFLSYGYAGYDAELVCSHFTILDMDEDKISEVVLDLSFYGREGSDFSEVLHYMNGSITGYLLSQKDLEELKSDGSFIYSWGAGDWGCAKLKFKSDGYEYDKLGYCESTDNGDLFSIDDKPCTEESFDAFIDEQEGKAETEWYEFSQKSIDTELTSMYIPNTTQTNLQAADAAKLTADIDKSGAPYFIVYYYDATNYLVSVYENQQGPGNYSGGEALYLVNKATGKVNANADIDLDKVDFNKYLTVYSELSLKIIE